MIQLRLGSRIKWYGGRPWLQTANDRNDADLAIGYRAALRRAAAAAREAAVLEDLLMARGASAIAGDEAIEVETMIVGAGRRSLELHETSLAAI